jgi:hypothetical protein
MSVIMPPALSYLVTDKKKRKILRCYYTSISGLKPRRDTTEEPSTTMALHR